MRKLLIVGFLAALALAVVPQTAQAAIAPDRLHVQLWPEQQDGSTLLLESAEYPARMKLPQVVKMALPKGALVQWAGEIFKGNDPSKDIGAKYKINPKKDYDEIVFTLTKTRAAQVEATLTGLKRVGAKRTLAFTWLQAYPAGTVDFAFKTPKGATGPFMTPSIAYQDKDADGLSFYGTGPMLLKVGQKQEVGISYQVAQASGTAGSGSNLALGLLVVGIGGGGIALTLYRQAQKGRH